MDFRGFAAALAVLAAMQSNVLHASQVSFGVRLQETETGGVWSVEAPMFEGVLLGPHGSWEMLMVRFSPPSNGSSGCQPRLAGEVVTDVC